VVIVRLCFVGATGYKCVALDKNRVFLIFRPRSPRAICYLVVCALKRSVVDWLVAFLFVVLYRNAWVLEFFMVLFPCFLLRCSLVASTHNPVALLGMDSYAVNTQHSTYTTSPIKNPECNWITIR
jgi:hypothetical protein